MKFSKWPRRGALLRAVTLLSIVLAGLFGNIAPAAAAPTRDTELGQVFTLARGVLPCGGSIRVWASTNPDWGDRSILNAQAQPMPAVTNGSLGTGSGSSVGGSCSVGVRVGWRNVNSGQTGEWRFAVAAGSYGSIQYALFQPTGKGHIVTDVTTDMPSIPALGQYDVF